MSCRGARPSLDEVYHFAHSVIVVRAPIPRDQIALSPPRILNGSFVEGRSLPLRSGAGLPDMNLGHSKRQKTARRSHELPQAVRDNSWGLSDRVMLEPAQALNEACTVDVALCEKLYDFPRPAIRSGGNSVICSLSPNREARLTVKFTSKMPRKILPSDLPSKPFAWER